jgi:hypothetical protein
MCTVPAPLSKGAVMRLRSASMLLSLVLVVFSVQSAHALTVRSAASQGTSGKSLIAAGHSHSCVLNGDGTVQCW